MWVISKLLQERHFKTVALIEFKLCLEQELGQKCLFLSLFIFIYANTAEWNTGYECMVSCCMWWYRFRSLCGQGAERRWCCAWVMAAMLHHAERAGGGGGRSSSGPLCLSLPPPPQHTGKNHLIRSSLDPWLFCLFPFHPSLWQSVTLFFLQYVCAVSFSFHCFDALRPLSYLLSFFKSI